MITLYSLKFALYKNNPEVNECDYYVKCFR